MNIYKVLERPLLSALLAGTAINSLQWFLIFAFLGSSVTALKWQETYQYPLLSTILFLIPYLVPFTVTTFGRKFADHKIQSVLNQFPESNPDVVMRFNVRQQLKYINPVGRQWLESQRLGANNNEALLPEEILLAFKTGANGVVIKRRLSGFIDNGCSARFSMS